MYFSATPLHAKNLGKLIPRRHGLFTQAVGKLILKSSGWQIVGNPPNIPQAVVLAVPHTSNFDGLYAVGTILALDLDAKLMGKKELFSVPILAQFLRWGGMIPIDRSKKGSVLAASVALFKTGKPLWLALAPEGTRKYTDTWKTGFYYIALEAGVPIIPIAMDYGTKQIRFMTPFYPTGDIDADLPAIYAYYKGVKAKFPDKLSKPLQEVAQKDD